MVESFVIRRATDEDISMVFELANDETVRGYSIHSEKISWDDHTKWFPKKIRDETCRYYIAETTSGAFIGQIRFDFQDSSWVTSISITSQFRGKGLAPRLLEKAFLAAHLDEAMAYIREDNIASQKSFLKAGYEKIGDKTFNSHIYQQWRKRLHVYIIAEMSANHCGDMVLAKKIIQAAKECGADAIKLQTYTADTMTIDCKSDLFKISGGTLWDEKYLYDLYKEAYTPWEWQKELKLYADSIGIELFSTPFDRTAVDFLEEIGVAKYKIASFEAVDIPLVEYVAAKGKPMIVSTGICSEKEIRDIVAACRKVGNEDLTLLKCTSAYPARAEDMNLLTLPEMKKFGAKIGLSDHTMHTETVVAAVALGATVIEKHFTLDRALGGADAEFSLNIEEFTRMVGAVRLTEKLLGKVDFTVNEKNRVFARSLFVCADIQKGEAFTSENIRSIRPGNGCSPALLPEFLGRKSNRDLSRGTPLSLDFLED